MLRLLGTSICKSEKRLDWLSLLAEVSHDEAKMRERRDLSFLSFLPRRERPLLAGKDWLAGISLNAFKTHVVQLCCSLGLLVSSFQIFVANEISPSNLKKDNPPGVDIPSGSAAMNKIIYKIQVQMMTKPL